MARRSTRKTAVDLMTAPARDGLAARKAPYSHSLGRGVALLLYVGANTHAWKSRTPEGGDKVIAAASRWETADIPPEALDGGLTFEQAKQVVYDRLSTERMSVEDRHQQNVESVTIGDAWASYIAWAEADGKTGAAMAVLSSYGRQMEPLFPLPVSTTPIHRLTEWRDGLVGTAGEGKRTRTPASVGKVVASLKAALNMRGIKGDWKDLTKPRTRRTKDLKRERRRVLTTDDLHQWLSVAHEQSPAFGALARGLALTGARPGELRQAGVGDVALKEAGGTLHISAGKTGARAVRLSPAARQFFASAMEGRDDTDPLFPNTEGAMFTAKQVSRAGKAAALAFGDASATNYSLRHTFITGAIYAGIPLTSIARQCGTSVKMIEETYSHEIEALEVAALGRIDEALGMNVKLQVVK